uniref:Uncharacterized protein n=1 Tax=Branchiostoma floridae TaxID=7739 RepID=C3Z5W7_BRAFL|eukprot:XP_002596218.1 hypothetical protein BRAFLDRAFT_66034 [Branchiostoma floridae]
MCRGGAVRPCRRRREHSAGRPACWSTARSSGCPLASPLSSRGTRGSRNFVNHGTCLRQIVLIRASCLRPPEQAGPSHVHHRHLTWSCLPLKTKSASWKKKAGEMKTATVTSSLGARQVHHGVDSPPESRRKRNRVGTIHRSMPGMLFWLARRAQLFMCWREAGEGGREGRTQTTG